MSISSLKKWHANWAWSIAILMPLTFAPLLENNCLSGIPNTYLLLTISGVAMKVKAYVIPKLSMHMLSILYMLVLSDLLLRFIIFSCLLVGARLFMWSGVNWWPYWALGGPGLGWEHWRREQTTRKKVITRVLGLTYTPCMYYIHKHRGRTHVHIFFPPTSIAGEHHHHHPPHKAQNKVWHTTWEAGISRGSVSAWGFKVRSYQLFHEFKSQHKSVHTLAHVFAVHTVCRRNPK